MGIGTAHQQLLELLGGRAQEGEVVVGLLLLTCHVLAQPVEGRVQSALCRL
jgi:hypothetical protein